MQKQSGLFNILIIVVLAFIWGSSFILMNRALFDVNGDSVFSPIEVGGLRVAIAGLVLLPFALMNLRKVTRKNFFPLLIAGLFGNCIPAFLFAKAQETLDSSFAGILNSLTPLFTFIVAVAFFKSKFKWLNLIGIGIGLIGAIGLIVSKDLSASGDFSMAFLVIAATLCYAISVNTIKNYLQDLKPLTITALAFSFVMVPAFIILAGTDFAGVISSNPNGLASLGYVSVLAIVGTAFAVALFNVLLKRSSAIFASTVTYLIPIVAIMWGLFDGEVIKSTQIIWTFVILLGVYFVKGKAVKKVDLDNK